MKLNQLTPVLLTSLFWVMPPVLAQEVTALSEEETLASSNSTSVEIPRVQDVNFPPVTLQELSQAPVIEVRGVQLNPTPKGLEIILETPDAGRIIPNTVVEDNRLISDIPNAVLILPEGNQFTAENPAAGIQSIEVIQLENNQIRVIVTGDAIAPKVAEQESDQGFIFSLTPGGQVAEDGTEEGTEIELVVTATRTEEQQQDIPRSVTVVEREELQNQAEVSQDLQDLLGKTVPGLSPQREQQYGPTLRGRNPLILIDGVPMSGNFTSGFIRDWRSIDPSAIEQVEVVRGPSAIYGEGAAGGIINIITRRPEDGLTVQSEIGVKASLDNFEDSFGYNTELFLSGRQGKVDTTLNFSFESTNRVYDARGNLIPLFDAGITNSRTFNILGKVGVDISEQQRLEVTANYFSDPQNYDYVFDPRVDEIPGRQFARAIDVGSVTFLDTDGPGNFSTLFSITYDHEDVLGSSVGTQLYYRDTTSRGAFYDFRSFDPEDPFPVGRSVQESERFGGRLQIDTPIVDSLSLLWGVDYSNEEVTETLDDFDVAEFDRSGRTILRKIGDRTVSPGFDVESLGFFGQLQWDITEDLVFNGGVRHERYGVDVPSYINDRGNAIGGGQRDINGTVFNAGLVYQFTPNFNIFTNFAQGFSLPDINRILRNPPENFDFDEDLDISDPIKVDSYEIGVRGNWRRVQTSLAAFYTESALGSSVLFVEDATEPGRLVRSPRRDYGIEAAVDWQPGARLALGGTLTFIEAENDIDEDGDYLAVTSFDIAPLKVTAYVEHQTTPRWSNRLQMLYVGDRDRAFKDGVDPQPIYSYVVLDYLSNVKIGPGTLSIGIENLLDTFYVNATSQFTGSYSDSSYFPARGRTFSFNYRFTW